MPRAVSSDGCRITGKVDGQPTVSAKPERGGVFGGKVYDGRYIHGSVSNGVFEISLPPSSELGKYTLFIGSTRFVIEVPNRPSCRLEELIQGGSKQ